MEYYKGRLCISVRELVDGGIMTAENCKKLATRGRIEMARNGRGQGNYALVVVDSLPEKYKAQIKGLRPDFAHECLVAWVRSNYEEDPEAVNFFHDKTKCGIELDAAKAKEYITNASVLNTCIKLYKNAKAIRKVMGERYDWDKMANVIAILRTTYNHTLPTSMLRFRKKVNEYQKSGYGILISGKFGNQNTRKVDHKVERLILGIAILPNKPWNTNVLELYNSFVTGELDVYDPDSGALFNPEDYTDKNGEPLELCETTINNYLNLPKNQILIKHKQEDWETFMHEQRPHVHRHDGMFSLSQITADDVDLSRKLKDTKKRVHAYYMYDDMSQCVIGAAYSRKKDQDLVVECFRDMFRTLEKHGMGMPAGIEVENHLMSEYKDGFLQAGVAFSFVRFCAPLNSQEKHAEAFNGAKKRSIIHKNHSGIGRFYGKGKWRMKSKKVSDENNDTWEDKQYYSYEELVADDMADNREWNNALHPNQKKYPGMSRWEVFMANPNPTLEPLDKLTLSRYIGEAVPTTIRRNSTVRVCYNDWWLSSPEVLEKLETNNYKVTAYYLPNEQGEAEDVYIFQNGRYIDKVSRVRTFNRLLAEQTEDDKEAFVEQQKIISRYDSYVNKNAIARVGILPRTAQNVQEAESEVIATIPKQPETEIYTFGEDYAAMAAADI